MSRQTRLAALIACGALMLGTTSCGSDDGPSANPEGASVTTAAPAGTSDGGTEYLEGEVLGSCSHRNARGISQFSLHGNARGH